jgi:hypothetical protein
MLNKRAKRRPNGSDPYPAASFRMPQEVIDKLKKMSNKNKVNDTQMLIALIERSYARTRNHDL